LTELLSIAKLLTNFSIALEFLTVKVIQNGLPDASEKEIIA